MSKELNYIQLKGAAIQAMAALNLHLFDFQNAKSNHENELMNSYVELKFILEKINREEYDLSTTTRSNGEPRPTV